MPIGAAVFTAGGTGQNFTTTSPKTFTAAPGTAPRAVAVAIVQNGSTADTITAVSYGGVALTRIVRAIDSVDEVGAAEIWFLGSGIPFPGTQTISITHTGTAQTKYPVAVGYAGDDDTEAIVFGSVEGDTANPQVALDTGAVEAIRIVIIFSGANAVGDLTILTGMTAVASNDFSVTIARYDRQTSNSSGSFTIGYTAASDDTALAAIAMQQIAGAAENPFPYIGGGYYPT